MWPRRHRGALNRLAVVGRHPYRRTGRPYVELGALGEITLSKVSLFLNLENILDNLQTGYHPMTLPKRAEDG